MIAAASAGGIHRDTKKWIKDKRKEIKDCEHRLDEIKNARGETVDDLMQTKAMCEKCIAATKPVHIDSSSSSPSPALDEKEKKPNLVKRLR